jgi:N6-L-threonylcarbamoyladenine synthase/ribosomal-protein-alanine N-acetyltransferase
VIRPATFDDLPEIMRLEEASFPTDAWSEAMMREELASPHAQYVVLEREGRVAGYAGLRALAGARDGDVQTIAVASDHRGRGSGRSLLRTLLEIARDRGVREVFLDVRADNPVAQTLYRSEGFTDIGRRPGYYQPDDVDAVVMKLDLAAWQPAAPAPAAPAPAATAPADTAPGGHR